MIDGLIIARAIHQAMERSSSTSASLTASSARAKSDALEADVDKLAMAVEALWLLLKEKLGCTDEELVSRIAEIDLRDGKFDGRSAVKSEPRICPSCGRTLSKRMPTCMYCGQPIQWDPFEK